MKFLSLKVLIHLYLPSPVWMVRPRYVQMTPVGAGAEVALQTTCTISPRTPEY